MVAIIKTGHSIRRTFHYNENKVKEGVATLLMAQNYPMETGKMSEVQRLNMLLKTAERNPNISRNSVHISLNFAPGEQLNGEQLKTIANEYMEAIGFGGQPYLVYQHNDAGHPHIHIATTLVNAQGKGIRMQNIGRTVSEKARKDIEQRYGLVKAEDHKKEVFQLKPLNIEKIQYGKTDTRRAIANILSHVLNTYKYTSLTELNAVLNGYNIHADPGSETSRTRQHKGLFYRLLDGNGQPVGVPIKASLFHNRPTRTFLEKRFLVNHAARKPFAEKVKMAIDLALKTKGLTSLQVLDNRLKKSGIRPIARINATGRLYGITYVDHMNKCVFNGSALGKQYSANAIQEQLEMAPKPATGTVVQKLQEPFSTTPSTPTNADMPDVLELLMQAEHLNESVPHPLRSKRKKKKKKNINPNQ
ncbi:relaxase/mobilization nuclease domain-containing protein [Pedobacter sp. ASV28]|uniref:relaxase/mobilization nuclease domain-containing protein n=1 Tax=Pedobacter sp. ASV28 TaxID=2795123 RepID=UPI0018EBAF3E|nr:relaxase/mobilization nuclease domain-containing protein [Pedobacter sp. ASV28]